MTFEKLAYVSCKDKNVVMNSLESADFEDQISWHKDYSDDNELWVSFDENSLQFLVKEGYLSVEEYSLIRTNNANTILFY